MSLRRSLYRLLALFVLVASPSMTSCLTLGPVTDVGSVVRASGVGQSVQPSVGSSNRSPFSYGAVLGITNGYDRWGVFAGPSLEYAPLPWLGIRASACYENDIYLFFQHYRVNGALLNADICFRWWHLVASLGANMDYYFAPVAERRIHGWHAYAGATMTSRPGVAITLAAGYVNRVDPHMLGYAVRGWSSVTPTQVFLQDVPRLCILLSATLRRK